MPGGVVHPQGSLKDTGFFVAVNDSGTVSLLIVPEIPMKFEQVIVLIRGTGSVKGDGATVGQPVMLKHDGGTIVGWFGIDR